MREKQDVTAPTRQNKKYNLNADGTRLFRRWVPFQNFGWEL